ncbi:Alpha/Beta hydrolase protein [Staphylotrichum tortipilum]|uniref:Alpha/Beta hydrolase protein n=1 Tax=Staphylotrichum tortipilum TaxID=2831512 RepID=A0AAN6MJA5_9PEZI|nr:Alpha/Beta hydrolase protein [Staphylotrichum longicolle]
MLLDLGPVSYLDCAAFCLLLAPQLVWQAGLLETAWCVLRVLPFVLTQLPVAFIRERYLTARAARAAFVRRASPFEDLVVRCVRYGFVNIPPRVGRVFFAREVAVPFLWFRLLRHGYLRGSPVAWREHREGGLHGIWLIKHPSWEPDFVLYYVHGGGFSLGSPYFYLEYLLTWLSVLSGSGYSNPAIFALDYTLVPDAAFPTQVDETVTGYEHVLAVARDPSIVCVSGDSAGATLILCLLLRLGEESPGNGRGWRKHRLPIPELAVLISPWATLVSAQHSNTESDYLDARRLGHYGRRFAGSRTSVTDPLASPGSCRDGAWWKRSSPSRGVVVTYGTAEVLAPDIEELIGTLRGAGIEVGSHAELGGIHAWPVASLFLSGTRDGRLDGLRTVTREIRQRVPGRRVGDGKDG